MAIIKLVDPDSGEVEELEECPDCEGVGGCDVSTDCEVYDDWRECLLCNGSGKVLIGLSSRDIFIPDREAFRVGD